MSQNIVEVTQDNAQEILIDSSHQQLVMVDFWADWCAPCKSLMPVLEKLAAEYAGQLLLAKVNADHQQMLAAQFGVRSLPTVILMKDGQPVDGFMGAQPESEVRKLLDKYLPKPWDTALQKAHMHMAAGEFSEALALLRPAYSESGRRADIAFALAHTLLELSRTEEVEKVLSAVGMVEQQSPEYQQLRAQLTLKQEASQTPEIRALEEKLSADPDNLDITYQLAVQLSQSGQQREALELLMKILRKDMGFQEGAAKAAFMDVIAALGKGDPLAVEYQRRFYAMLY